MHCQYLGSFCLLTAALCGGCNHQTSRTEINQPTGKHQMGSSPDIAKLFEKLPLVAVWTEPTRAFREQSLRIAIWDDGWIVFGANDEDSNATMRFGRLSLSELEELNQEIRGTGIFDLKGHCYLVPDARVMCLLSVLDGKKQLLYWDEVEQPNYGINSNPKPHHLQFMKVWKLTNHLALAAIPAKSVPLESKLFIPDSWYVKRAIQSE